MKTASKKINRQLILQGNMLKAIMSIAVPVVINSFLQTMYNLTDTFWLGQIGKEQLAAINLVSPIQNIVVNFGSGITVAGAVLIAQYVGAGKLKEAKSMANQIWGCAMVFAVVCSLILLTLTGGIVGWLGAEGITYQYSVTYLRIVIMDMPFLFMVNIFQSVNQAQGNTVKPMLLNLLGITLNMILDPLLMIVFDLNIAGAALATVLSKAVPAVIAFLILSDKQKSICLDVKHLKFAKEKIKTILSIGLPTAIGGSTMQLGFLLMSKNVFAYGVNAMAAYGIGNKVNGLISLPSNGIGSATATIVGQNMGALQEKRAEKGYRMAMFIAMGFLFVGGMILSRSTVSTAIVSIFSNDKEVIAMAADFLSVIAFWCWTNGIYNATSGLFQGTGHTEVTMAVDATRLWIFRFITLFICEQYLHMGVRSIWYSVVVSNGISSGILLILYFMGIWKKSRIKIDQEEAGHDQTISGKTVSL